MITLHHLENSRSIRILWLLEELGIPYDLKHYRREPGTSFAEEEFKQLHPLGKAPLISDGERMIAESGAIIEYLLDRHGDSRLRPSAGSRERERYNYWMHAAEGSIMNVNTLALVMNRMDERAPWPLRPLIRLVTNKVRDSYIGPTMEKLFASMERELATSRWFAGDQFSAADIQMGYVMSALEIRGGLNTSHSHSRRWIEQMKARPAYRSAMEKNGEFTLLKS